MPSGPRREARAASCPVALEACRSITGNRSLKLAFGARCVVRTVTVWDLNGRGTRGKRREWRPMTLGHPHHTEKTSWQWHPRVPLLGCAGPETVCHCLEQAVRGGRKRRAAQRGLPKALWCWTAFRFWVRRVPLLGWGDPQSCATAWNKQCGAARNEQGHGRLPKSVRCGNALGFRVGPAADWVCLLRSLPRRPDRCAIPEQAVPIRP